MASNDIFIPWEGWELVGPIGRGSFGTVYEIRMRRGKRTERAAMKVIPISADMLDDMYGSQYDENTAKKLCEDSLRNIEREYNLVHKLRGNPNIVRVDDMKVVGHRDGIGCDVYIRMELLTPLQKLQKTTTVTEKDVIALGTDICRALTVCEQHNIIHRDIKPQNILVTENGAYKLGDFGTAKTFEHTVSATMAGTETYMAPEVIRREKYGRDVDTYSLGLVMYRMLNNGQLPFLPAGKVPSSADRAKSLQRRISGERLPEPATGSPALKAVVMKACSYDRRNRYRSAVDMLDDLMMAAEGTMPLFPHDPDDDETVAEQSTRLEKKNKNNRDNNGGKSSGKSSGDNRKSTDSKSTDRKSTDNGSGKNGQDAGKKKSGTDKGGKSNRNAGGKPGRKVSPVIIVIALVLAVSIIYGIAKGTGDEEPVPTPQETTEQNAEQNDTSTEETATTAGEEEMAWIQYEMWDNPSKGSGADNSDDNHATFWTVYYDRDTGIFRKITEEQWFNMEGYTEDEVNEYVDRLSASWSGDEYSFIQINYKGGVTGEFGNQYVLQIEYNNIDDTSARAKADHIFMAVDWGTTIDDADKTIKNLGGERYRAGINSEDDAIAWASYFANAKQLVPSGVTVGYMPEDTTTDSSGHPTYLIRVYEDHPDHIATLYWWNVDSYGAITDNESGEMINDLQYPDY